MNEAGQTILVVDDEPLIRRLLRSLLQPLNLEILEAGTGNEALEIFEQHGQSIALLLTDVVMPGMHGDALAARLLESRPNLPVIFISAYCTQIQPALRKFACLSKPFRLEDVRSTVCEMLARDRHEVAAFHA